MSLRVATLLSAALGVSLIGLGYLISPQFMFGLYGIGLESVNGMNMVRSAYGGLFAGFALLFGLGAARPELARPALLGLFTFMAGLAAGRIASIAIDRLPSPLILGLTGVEIAYACVAGYLLTAHHEGSR